ncbi:hypothetical protein HMPREF9056_00842 [Actinomyces sp. oral taxon 170 str. F0386]|nr:hypothetical protein HMPREF9056_00842 [Actinomyces sp. oral taxon 170 str. F0386]
MIMSRLLQTQPRSGNQLPRPPNLLRMSLRHRARTYKEAVSCHRRTAM